MIKFLQEVIEDLFLHITHGILLLGILADLGDPGTTGFHIILVNPFTGCGIQFLELVVVKNHLVAPSPTVVTVTVMDIGKAVEHLLDIVDYTTLDVLNQPLFLALRQEQTTQIHPLALADGTHRSAHIPFLLGTLQHSTHIDTQGDIVVLQTLPQRRGIDHILMEIVSRDIVTRGMTQVLQDLDTLHDLSHGKGREPVEVDDTLPRLLRTLVTFRPFLDITIETHRCDVSARHQITVVTIGHEIRER